MIPLPHGSRRSFLKAVGAGTGSLMLGPAWLRAKEVGLQAFSFVVVSDTHVGRHDQPGAAQQWRTTAEAIDRCEADFVLHLGDLVDLGREVQYPIYRETRQRIRKPVHEIPGNHDPQPLFEKYIRTPVDTTFDHRGVRFLLLNDAHTDSHDGFISPAQLVWLDQQCADAASKDLFLVLCAHVPVHTNKSPDRGWYVKPANGQAACYEILGHHRNRLLALMHGHFHNGLRGWSDQPPWQEIVFPSALYNQDRQLAQRKAPGYYLPELRPGFVRVTFQAGEMTLQYQPIEAAESTTLRLTLPSTTPSTTGRE